MATLFVSDLHLETGRPDISQQFSQLLAEQTSLDALYLLGDVFEVWLGDDVSVPEHQAIIQQLAQLQCPKFFMPGNRDFLIGQQLCEAAGFTLLPDPSVVTIGHQRILLMHGDSLCTDDQAYQQFRQQHARNPSRQRQFLALPAPIRHWAARRIRRYSQQSNQRKDLQIMDVNQNAVNQALHKHDCKLLIHGHTHRPARHRWQNNGKSLERIVLGDWDIFPHSLHFSANDGWQLRTQG